MLIHLDFLQFNQEVTSTLEHKRNVIPRAKTSCKLVKQLHFKEPIES
jgi:hypothetical protein